MSDATKPRWREEGGVIGVVVHPRRELDKVLGAVRDWAEQHGGSMCQVAVDGQERRVADLVEAEECDVLLALGGDGTVLGALHAGAACGKAVLGVACGSLGALTSVKAPDIGDALDRFASGRWDARPLPGLRVIRDGEELGFAFNDLVVVRNGAGQVILDVEIDGGTYARMAGDGLVLATPLGSSAYTFAAGGPLLASTADVVVLTPLSMHGGSAPSVVVAAGSAIEIAVDGGWAGARLELDGRIAGEHDPPGESEPFTLRVEAESRTATLLDFDGETLIAGLRRRGLIADSPRVGIRQAREKTR